MNEILENYKKYLITRGYSLYYLNVMRIFLTYLEEQKIEPNNLNQSIITDFFALHSDYCSGTKNSYIKAGRSFYEFLGIKDSAWVKIKLMKVPQKIPEYFTEKMLEEAKKQIITNHSRKMTPLKIRTILDFLYYTGIRKSELLALKRKDIDLENNIAKVWGKGDKERIICFPKKVSKELTEFFMSCNEENNALNIKLGQLHYLIKMINKCCGINIHVHSFRHGYAKTCLKKGIDLPTLSRLLGHVSVLTTMIYANPSTEEMQENYQAKMNKGDKDES